MKHALLVSRAGSLAVETFDIATFKSPHGWDRQVTEISIRFSTEDKSDWTVVRKAS